MNNTEDVIEIDLQELLGLILNRLWLIILCGIVAGAAGFCVSNYLLVPQYQSTTKVYILNKNDNSTLTYSDMQLGTQLTKDYAQLIKSRDVLEQVIETCGLTENYDSFSQRVTVENISDTRIIAITVEDMEPSMAQFIANEVRRVAADHIKNVMDIQAVNVAEEANLPESPSSPNIIKWTALGLMLGVFLSAMIVIVRFLMDDTVKSSEDVERYLGLSTLAMIPIMEDESLHRGKRKKKRKQYEVDLEADSQNEIEVEELGSANVKGGK